MIQITPQMRILKSLTPEYAYLTDLKHRRADGGWKALRTAKAKSALKTLARIAPTRRAAEGWLSR